MELPTIEIDMDNDPRFRKLVKSDTHDGLIKQLRPGEILLARCKANLSDHMLSVIGDRNNFAFHAQLVDDYNAVLLRLRSSILILIGWYAYASPPETPISI